MVGLSLVPLTVMVTVPVVPSAVVTVKVSVSFSPAPRAWTLGSLLLSSYFQLPLASMENLPYVPAMSVWGLNTASPLSGSTTSSLPLAVSLSSSVTEPLSSPGLLGVMMAPSLVPLILTVMVSGSCHPCHHPRRR